MARGAKRVHESVWSAKGALAAEGEGRYAVAFLTGLMSFALPSSLLFAAHHAGTK